MSSGYVPHRVYKSGDKRFSDFEAMLAELSRVDVAFVGEQHNDPATHRIERAILEGLARRRGNVIVAMEMFERDTQGPLDDYLAGRLSEEEFLNASRDAGERDGRVLAESGRQRPRPQERHAYAGAAACAVSGVSAPMQVAIGLRLAVDAWEAALDDVEASRGPAALVTTGSGKFFSNGLDLERLIAEDTMAVVIPRVLHLFARLLRLPVYSVAAINGHAYAAGAMMAMAHDARVMRVDRGWWCLPEVDMGVWLAPGMSDLVAAKLPAATAHEAAEQARQFGTPDFAEGVAAAAERREPRFSG